MKRNKYLIYLFRINMAYEKIAAYNLCLQKHSAHTQQIHQ